jgi:hypothetical protein
MQKKTRRRGHGLALAVFVVVASVPELARAQQMGLFPNHPIKRQRVPCDQEDPIYKVYKNQYFGYHPTCWRTFPAGWGCPSPQAPDKAKSFAELPLAGGAPGDKPEDGDTDDGGMQGQPGVTRPTLPPLQGGTRSPFEDNPDDKATTPPRNPRGAPNPLPTPPSGDPFELDNKPTDTPAAPRAGVGRSGAASAGPELSPPAEAPAPNQGLRSSRNDGVDDRESDDDGPVLALPRVNLPPVDDAGVPFGTKPPATTASATPADGSNPAPRRSFLSGFFNNLGINWVRR